MATQSAVFIPEATDYTTTVTTAASSAEIVIGTNRLFALTADGDFHLRIGNSGMSAASTSNYKCWANTVYTYDFGSYNDRIRIYNPGGSTVNIFIQYLSRA